MEYFNCNYSKLKNIPEIKLYKLAIVFILISIILVEISLKVKIYQHSECYGIYENNVLVINIERKLSENLGKSEYIIFDNKKVNFKIKEYGEYEIINNEIYQEIKIIVDKVFYHNQVGVVEFYYDKKSVFKFIVDLFK